jgi:hypothetical protein
MRRWIAVSYCSQPYYIAIRQIVPISDYGSLRTVEAELFAVTLTEILFYVRVG